MESKEKQLFSLKSLYVYKHMYTLKIFSQRIIGIIHNSFHDDLIVVVWYIYRKLLYILLFRFLSFAPSEIVVMAIVSCSVLVHKSTDCLCVYVTTFPSKLTTSFLVLVPHFSSSQVTLSCIPVMEFRNMFFSSTSQLFSDTSILNMIFMKMIRILLSNEILGLFGLSNNTPLVDFLFGK